MVVRGNFQPVSQRRSTNHAIEYLSGVGSAIFEKYRDEFDSATIVGDFGADTGQVVVTEFAHALGSYVYPRDLTEDEVLYDLSDTDGGESSSESRRMTRSSASSTWPTDVECRFIVRR